MQRKSLNIYYSNKQMKKEVNSVFDSTSNLI